MTSSRLNHLGASSALLAAVALVASVVSGAALERLSVYSYRDTKDLVALVEDAAALIERKGDEAYKDFAQKDSKWLNDECYVCVYSLHGTCLFHPLTPELVGQNAIELRDMNRKPIIRFITNVGRRPAKDAHGWVFYLWQNQTQLTPNWKSAYIRKVIAPNGQTWVVGSGSYNNNVEKPFVEERVRMAANLLASAGKDRAFTQFRNPATPYVFLDTFIFVLDEQGRTLVDPAFPTMAGRDLSDFKEAVGFP